MKRKTKLLAAFLAVAMLLSMVTPIMSVSAASAADRMPDPVKAVDTYIDEFFYYDNRRGGQLRNMPSNGFWTDAEVLEMFIDAYEQIGDPQYLTVAEQFYDGIIYRRSEDWSWNEYNDDVFWMSLATIRLYENTKNEEYLRVAKANYDMCYARAWDTSYLGGGFWWTTNNHEKNGCVNGPGALAALKIYLTTGDEKYLNYGIEIMEWEFEYLFEEDTGRHLDNIDINGNINTWTNTGNQGNIIGPCTMLYKITGEQRYFDYAKKAADHAATLGDGKLGLLNEGANSGDTIGGKGLLGRWLGYFVRECDVRDYDKWMMDNARAAWNMRNAEGLMWGLFSKQTVDDIRHTDEIMEGSTLNMKDYAAWGCSAAVAWLLQTPGLLDAEDDTAETPDDAAPVITAPDATDDGDNGNVVTIVIAVAAVVVVAAVVTVVVVVVSKKKRANR